MATISFRLSDEEKNIISKFSKENNLTVSEFILNSIFSKIEDREDYLLGEKRMLDTKNKVTGDLRKLAEDCGIDYDKL
ncbi:hypothetical protein F350042L8_33850 [Fusobacterium ulcerans]|uniref:DUF6290 family protein n=1 Tax=Fusobacterium ulcerans TaxID=861 RepID=UPI0034C2C07E